MAKPKRKSQNINWDEFDKLVSYQCTQIEIASFFDVSVDTLERACIAELGETLADVWNKRKAMGRVRLRKMQYEIVERGGSGASTMAIWLDKKVFPDETPRPPVDPPAVPFTAALPFQGKLLFSDFCANAGYPRPFPRQIEMMDFIINGADPRLLLGSRGYGKTDYATILGVAYDIYINGANTSNLIITKSKARNAAIVYEIATALKANGVLLEKENSTCIRIAGMKGKDHSVEALTIKASFRGRHPKRTLMDDPVTEEDTSEAMRKLVKKKYNEAMKLTSNIGIIGQPAHPFDLYAELRGIVSKMEVPFGSIPELDADLEAMKNAGVDPASIEMSYHLRIPKEGTTIFANLKYIPDFPTGDSVAFIDPSDGGDFTAMSVVKGQFDGIAVQGHAWKKAWYHCLDEIVAVLKARGVRKLCFETNCTGKQPLVQLRTLLAPLGIGVVGVHSDSNKHAVIQSAGSYAHLIYLSQTSDRVYTEQVIHYESSSKYDDAPDSLARCLEWLGFIRGKNKK